MKVAITGANGKVGQALIGELDPTQFKVTPLDLPEHDASNLDDLVKATKDHDALIHLAWKDLAQNTWGNTIDPVNALMFENAYEAARINNIKRVIMGSSNHAHNHAIRDIDGKIRVTTLPTEPNNPYGAEKVFMESLGKYYARANNIGVICLRIGNINEEDNPKPSSADNPQRWLSHTDLGRLVTACLNAETVPDNFQIIYGVSQQEVFDWSNPFGYEPLDHAD